MRRRSQLASHWVVGARGVSVLLTVLGLIVAEGRSATRRGSNQCASLFENSRRSPARGNVVQASQALESARVDAPSATPATATPTGVSVPDLASLQGFLSPEELGLPAGLGRYQEYSLLQLLDPNPETNLVTRHPLLAMSASQRMLALLNSKGSYPIREPLFGLRQVRVYPTISHGIEMAGGRRVIGQLQGIEAFMDILMNAARGDGSRKVPLLEGPPGTGKTEILSIIKNLARNLAVRDARYGLMTFEWKDLDKIPNLAPLVRKRTVRLPDGRTIILSNQSEMLRSPLSILPEVIQQRVVAMARSRVRELIDTDPRPFLSMDPKDAEIRDAILRHYSQGRELTPAQIVAVLNQHVTVRPRTEVSPVLLSSQGRDVPEDQLTFVEDPIMLSIFGPGHPFSYYYTGSIPRADGSVIIFDEVLRNPEHFLNMLLHLAQSHELQRGGSPLVDLDTLVVMAANTESIEGGKSDMRIRAFLDRARRIEFLYAIHPWETLKIGLLQRGGTLEVTPLPGSQAERGEDPWQFGEWRTASLDQLVTNPDTDGRMQTPYRRYAVRRASAVGTPSVFISPHALEYMALIAAATRINTDREAAGRDNQARHILNGPEFNNPVNRLSVILGDVTIAEARRRELEELHFLLKEGSRGLSNRDFADTWLVMVMDEALKPGNGNTVTPNLVLKVFEDALRRGGITASQEDQIRWLTLAHQIGDRMIAPLISQDWELASSEGEDSVDAIYQEIMDTLATISSFGSGGGASQPIQYRNTRTGAVANIDYTRLEAVRRAYREINSQDLDPSMIVTTVFNNQRSRGVGANEPYLPLKRAVARYLSGVRLSTTVSTGSQQDQLERVIKALRDGEGDTQILTVANGFAHTMVRQLGYNPHSVVQALEFVRDMAAKRTR